MPRCKTFTAAVLGGALFTAAAIAQGTFAQGTGRWTTGMPMPSSRTEIAVAEVDGKIYVVGGFRGERELEIYDPSTDRWSRGASIPRAVHHAGAAGLNGRLYVIGGFVEGWTPTDEVHEYDPASGRWQRLAPCPQCAARLRPPCSMARSTRSVGSAGAAATPQRTRSTILLPTGGRHSPMCRRRATTWRPPQWADASMPILLQNSVASFFGG
jgi:hypothetical protein